jgi:hypothetical protein
MVLPRYVGVQQQVTGASWLHSRKNIDVVLVHLGTSCVVWTAELGNHTQGRGVRADGAARFQQIA